MKKISTSWILLLAIILMLTACGETAKETEVAQEEPIVIKLGHVQATDHPVNIALQGAADKIAERTNGMVDLQIYPNGELAAYQDGIEAIRSGAAYIFYSSPGQFIDYVPDMAALQSPYLVDSIDTYEKLMDTPVIKKLCAAAEEQGIHPITMNFLIGYRDILTDYQIKDVSDVNHLKIRIPGNKVWIDTFEAMNANTVSINWNETYTALQQGVISAIECPPSIIYAAKMHEQKKVATATGHLLDMSGCFIGTSFWETIPTEYRNIITEEIEAAAKANNAACEENEAMYKQMLIDEGVTYYDVDKTTFIEATKDVVLQYDIGEELLQTVQDIQTGKIS